MGPRHADRDHETQTHEQEPHLRGRDRAVEAQQERQQVRRREQPGLDDGGDHDAPPRQRREHPVEDLVGVGEVDQGGGDQLEVVEQRGVPRVLACHADLVGQHDVDVGLLGVLALREQLGLVAVDDRRHVRDPGARLENGAVVLRVHQDVLLELGTRAHQAHVAHEHVPQLRQLVDLGVAQEVPDPGDPLILAHRDAGAELGGVVHHGPELDDVERLQMPSHPPLAEEHRARAVEPDRDGRHREHRGEQDQADGGEQEVQQTLHRRWASIVLSTAAITSSTSSSVIFA